MFPTAFGGIPCQPLLGLSLCLLLSCKGGTGLTPDEQQLDFRQEMRQLVMDLNTYAQGQAPGFFLIPQNGQKLVQQDGGPAQTYLDAIAGLGREDLYYGYEADNRATPVEDRSPILTDLRLAHQAGKAILVTDYCWDSDKVADSRAQVAQEGFVGFAAPSRELDVIPADPPPGAAGDSITDLSQIRNFLYLINPGTFADADALVAAVQTTDYDLVILDAFFDEDMLTAAQVAALRQKAGGGRRLVVAYFSIGEAEDYRYYWQAGWDQDPPSWLAAENRAWRGNYKVKYWQQGWQDILFGTSNAYLDRILAAGFDGAYLDIIDAFAYFEEELE
ncbi:MAG: hypothetical protein D6722_24380 [Bacteroidetes bacterium]|nr:MAG: hypothetical protein D6722_24380 [Bacteroidota bacterium]